MPIDLPSHLMAATVEIEQPLADGRHIVGTGFLVDDPAPDGHDRTVLVTAAHVLEKMTGSTANLGYRVQNADGSWKFNPSPITIRAHGRALWARNPDHDVAAITIKAPAQFAKAAVPLSWLAEGDAFSRASLGPGDEMLVLGYPQGLSADPAGFPILRSGRIASPVQAVNLSPTFLLDFRVFAGNSGGPVFRQDGAGGPAIVGMLTQQVELDNVRLEIGVVTDSPFIRDTVAMMDGHAPAAETAVATGSEPVAKTAAATPSAWVGTEISE